MMAATIGGPTDAAEPKLSEVLHLPPAVENAAHEPISRAIEKFQQGDIAACHEHLTKLAAAHSELPPAPLLLARLHLAAGQIAAGRAALERAAIERPEDPRTYLVLADLALNENRVTDAAVLLEKAAGILQAAPDDFAPRDHIHALAGAVTVAERRGDWKAAEQTLAQWLSREPKAAAVRQRRGRALFRLGQHDEAQAELERAARDDANLEPAAVTLGWLHHQAGESEEAREWMDRAVAEASENPAVRRAAAAWHLECERPQEALGEVDALAKLEPNSADIARLRGVALRMLGRFSEAERMFDWLYRRSPADADAANQLVLVLIEQDDAERRRRAVELAEVNARQYPSSAAALASLGWIYYRVGRLEEAERVLRAATASGHANSETAYYLARVLADRGQTGEARTLAQAALGAPGPFPSRTAAEAWLKALPPVASNPPKPESENNR